MNKNKITIEINGRQQIAGYILGDDFRDARFQYSQEYLSIEGIKPISLNLPLQSKPFTAKQTSSFFEGLLPEGFSRRAVANWAQKDESDYLSILKCLGQECLGAIQVLAEEEAAPAGSYQLLTTDQVKALAAEGATTSTKLLMETHLSLTGASGKVGLYYDEKEDDWYLPIGSAASTHIVKQSHVRLDQIVLNEQICMKTAQHIGIEVPDSFIINMNQARDEDVLYATRRYDRHLNPDIKINELAVPYRLHQEDFAQALGIPASQKYEQQKSGYLKKMFDLLRKQSSDPLADQMKLWDRVIFNFLIGNTDCHLKNYSLLYNQNLTGIRLGPAYDIVCTRAYKSTNMMSFYIGNEIDIERMNRDCFKQAAREIGLGPKLAMKRFDHLANLFEAALDKAVGEIEEQGFAGAVEFKKRIFERCGYQNVI